MSVAIPPIRVDPRTILAWHGYKDLSRVPAEIVEEAERVAGGLGELLKPAVAFRKFSVESATDGAVELEGGWTFKSRVLARLVSDAPHAVLFVATIGEALENRVSALFEEGEFLASVLLDAAGTLALHRIVRALRMALAREVPPGYRLLGRAAPGYGDWDIYDQFQLFSALGEPLPARLNESGVMVPKKSVSGLIGFVPLTPAVGEG
jgi:hypothetical protein